MKVKLHFRSFRHISFLLTFSLMLVMVMIISFVAIWDATVIMKKEAMERNENTAVQMQCAYDVVFRQLNQINSYNYLDVNVQAFMTSNVPDLLYDEFAGKFVDLTRTYRYIQNYIYEIGFYASEDYAVWISGLGDSHTSIPVESYADASICDYIDQMQPYENGFYHHLYGNKHPYVLTFIKKNKEGTGGTFLSVNLEKLTELITDESVNCYIVSSDGTVLYSKVRKEIGTKAGECEQLLMWLSQLKMGDGTLQEESMILSSIKSNRYDWYYVAVRNVESMEISKDRVVFVGMLAVVGSLMGLFIAFVSSRKAAQPLERVMDMLESNEILTSQCNYEETKNIAQKMAAILSSNKLLKESLEESLREFTELQNTALQYQMNPHFLYNTLNLASVYAAKEMGRRHDVVTLIRKLSEILRYSMDVENTLVSLEEEVAYVKIYIEILEKRYRENFGVSWQIPIELMEAKIIRMSIQPLIENAVYHGIQPQGGGKLTISAVKTGNHLNVWVCDDGVGIEQTEIEKLNQRIRQGKLQSRHIGLANVQQRLQLMFGMEYGIMISPQEDKGIRVCMTLPYLEMVQCEEEGK